MPWTIVPVMDKWEILIPALICIFNQINEH